MVSVGSKDCVKNGPLDNIKFKRFFNPFSAIISPTQRVGIPLRAEQKIRTFVQFKLNHNNLMRFFSAPSCHIMKLGILEIVSDSQKEITSKHTFYSAVHNIFMLSSYICIFFVMCDRRALVFVWNKEEKKKKYNMNDASVNSNDSFVVAGVCHGAYNLLRIHSQLTHVYQKVQLTGHIRILCGSKNRKIRRMRKNIMQIHSGILFSFNLSVMLDRQQVKLGWLCVCIMNGMIEWMTA